MGRRAASALFLAALVLATYASVGPLRHGGVHGSTASAAFLEALKGGTVDLEGLSIVGVGSDGRPLDQALRGRGFLMADGGRLVLKRDRIVDLGYLWDTSFGISFRESLPGSAVIDC